MKTKKLIVSTILSSLLLSNFCFAFSPENYHIETVDLPRGQIVKVKVGNIDKSVSYYHSPTQETFSISDKNYVEELGKFTIENNLVKVHLNY